MSKGQPKPASEVKLPDGWVNLSKEQTVQLDEMMAYAKKGMPAVMAADMQRIVEQMKIKGVPKEFSELLDETAHGRMNAGSAAKLFRVINSTARRYSEDDAEGNPSATAGEAGEAEQKTSSEPGPSTAGAKKGKSQKKGEPEGFEFKLDISTFFISAVTAYLLYRLVVPHDSTREITWQEFRNTFFDKGLVEKLVVQNGGDVKVYLHREAVAAMYPESPAAQPGFHYFFTIWGFRTRSGYLCNTHANHHGYRPSL